MPKRGRKPKPADQKEREGNAGRRQAIGPEVGALPVPPPWIPKRARPTWDRVVPQLAQQVALKQTDAESLADYIVCIFRLSQCERRLEREGLMVKGQKGNRVKNPAAMLTRQYRVSVQRWASHFGCTPAERQRVPGSTQQKTDPLAAARARLREQAAETVH